MTGITVTRFDEQYDVWGARVNGAGMETYEVSTRGWLGNPWSLEAFSGMGDHQARKAVIVMYAGAFDARQQRDREFRFAVKSLDGSRVACFCRSANEQYPPCHLDVVDAYLRGDLDLFVERLMCEDADVWGEHG